MPPDISILCGIHDSNASLLPHLLAREAPFAVVSTGTWVVAMAVRGRPVPLDAARDVLVNVNALGDPVPSARFMGGREYELICKGRTFEPTMEDRATVLRDAVMLLPSVEPSSGPFPGAVAQWTAEPATDGAIGVALSWYLALMTATCLDLVGADGDIIVEGTFAANPDYVAMLGSATGRPVVATQGNASGTSAGAARLFQLVRRTSAGAVEAARRRVDPTLHDYAVRWLAKAQGRDRADLSTPPR